ncbi:SsgA family sporulation/cell division regulator [Streptomyces sp. NPDC059944]|uniref:SsgA family sporulation/cell division regulator n=1 Tax=unclassified Streptomyces TaxID=2593676 RepID=UPI003669017F
MSSFIAASLRQRYPFPFAYLMYHASLVGDGRAPVSLNVTWRYSAQQPFAVVMTVRETALIAEWSLSREQLLKGLRQHEGSGDVAVWPSTRHAGEDVIRIRLGAPPSLAVIEIERQPLTAWLQETLKLIPAGTETDFLRLDSVISRILDAGA